MGGRIVEGCAIDGPLTPSPGGTRHRSSAALRAVVGAWDCPQRDVPASLLVLPFGCVTEGMNFGTLEDVLEAVKQAVPGFDPPYSWTELPVSRMLVRIDICRP